MTQEQLNGYALIELTTHEGETFTLPSYIDTHGTRRYVVNRVIDVMWDNGLIDLNNLAILLERAPQAVPLRDVITFWAMLGYSVCGMCDLSFMHDVKVVTPEWTQDPDTYDEEDE